MPACAWHADRPIGNVAKRRGKAKVKISAKREAAMKRIVDSYSEEFDVKPCTVWYKGKMTVIQELIPLGLKAVADELQGEVRRLALHHTVQGLTERNTAAQVITPVGVIRTGQCIYGIKNSRSRFLASETSI